MSQGTSEKSGVVAVAPLLPLEDADITKAKKTLDAYIAQRVFSPCLFEDNKWPATDERAGYNLRFDIDTAAYRRDYEPLFGLTADEFIEYLKTYIICLMGTYALDTLRQILYFIRRLITTPPDNLNSLTSQIENTDWWHISEFCSILPIPEKHQEQMLPFLDAIQEEVDIVTLQSASGKQRELASMDSYFKFGDILECFIGETADEFAKLFYYPLYLWWEITGVLPLRPCEFIVTPRDCLSCVDGKWKLTIRRNRIKGANHTVGYKIGIDFATETYEIPESLAQKIQWYIDRTANLPTNAPNLLFIADIHYKKWDRSKPYTSRYFTYMNLSTVMRYFYNEVIVGIYGYKIVYDRGATSLPEHAIHYLHLGDTRHIALINIIAEGGTPVVAMMLAGHDSIDMSSHYFSNVNQLIECKTRRLYTKMLSGGHQYALSPAHTPLVVQTKTALPDGGQCCDSGYANGCFNECAKCVGPNGELGYCLKCPHYRSTSPSFNDNSARYKTQIEHDCRDLASIVKLVRATKTDTPEDVVECMLRLKADVYSYQQFLLETQEEKNGKT